MWSKAVARYMAGCVKCQKSKADRPSRQTKLELMLTGECAFKEIARDLIEELLESKGFNTILVGIYRYTKV